MYRSRIVCWSAGGSFGDNSVSRFVIGGRANPFYRGCLPVPLDKIQR